MGKPIETYQIQAYVDGQLSREECLEIEAEMMLDPDLQDQVCHLRTLKSQVKEAYQAIPVPERVDSQKPLKRVWSVPKTAAASLLLGVVLGAGMLGGYANFNSHSNMQMAGNFAPGVTQQNKYIVHLDSEDFKKQARALQEIERLLAQGGSQLQVDFISNAEGVRMFDVKNPNRPQLEALLERYDNLTLYACKRALQRVFDRGEAFEVIPQVQHDKPAIDAVAERLNKGWKYIKI
ncbi:hypothetical protein [Thiomicrorhabdus chilensis]|uniref:hypothetical protein n=1 Tax=Thiomicrorhabdus chilensis TaxID=63656 RepID=UPI00040B2212|nr:hypothetical protein [Thiomicrorhabdus chilensis]